MGQAEPLQLLLMAMVQVVDQVLGACGAAVSDATEATVEVLPDPLVLETQAAHAAYAQASRTRRLMVSCGSPSCCIGRRCVAPSPSPAHPRHRCAARAVHHRQKTLADLTACAACACRECYQHRDLPHRGRDCAGARRERPRVRAEQRAGSNRAEVRRVRRCVGGLHCMDDEGLRRDTGGRSGCVRLSAASGSVIGLFCGVTRSWRFRQRAAIQNTCRSSYKHCGGVVCTGCTLHCTSTQSRCR